MNEQVIAIAVGIVCGFILGAFIMSIILFRVKDINLHYCSICPECERVEELIEIEE